MQELKKKMFAKWEGPKLGGGRNFNFKLQVSGTSNLAWKKSLPKLPDNVQHCWKLAKRSCKNMKRASWSSGQCMVVNYHWEFPFKDGSQSVGSRVILPWSQSFYMVAGRTAVLLALLLPGVGSNGRGQNIHLLEGQLWTSDYEKGAFRAFTLRKVCILFFIWSCFIIFLRPHLNTISICVKTTVHLLGSLIRIDELRKDDYMQWRAVLFPVKSQLEAARRAWD